MLYDRASVVVVVVTVVSDPCNPKDCNPPGSSVREIFQAIILEWVVVSFSGDGKSVLAL